MKVLISQLRSYGDIIRTFPTIRAIRKTYPNAYIAFTCVPEMEQAAKLCNELDEVIIQQRLLAPEDHVGHTRLVDTSPLEGALATVKEVEFDYYIDFHGIFQTALFGLMANIPNRIGPGKGAGKDGSYLFYNHHYTGEWKRIHRMKRHVEVAKTVFPTIQLERSMGKFSSDREKPLLIIAPGTSEIGIYKRWPIEYYKPLIQAIIQDFRVNIQIVCSSAEKEIGEKIIQSISNDNCTLVECKSFEHAYEVIQKGHAFIGCDSAYTHIATVEGIPSFMLLGPTPPSENAPWEYVDNSYAYLDLDCSPCNLWDKACPHHVQCMSKLLPEKVYKEVFTFLNKLNWDGCQHE
ncbi:glycosyltransferase family 9 protein [Evansella sp. AB-P1]|uniref:glycosyltransferase family 9 protein n=1 Tax=Evansella sp. AB-P1 TaxID=3037653 RepID=UPI00241D4173|nr:glycosyltransferase family 9 protein [Evansella sp. AB-P1]MDG5788350.1 glycosyltransferase family 9 protein [Evansella sp. AB-P1]